MTDPPGTEHPDAHRQRGSGEAGEPAEPGTAEPRPSGAEERERRRPQRRRGPRRSVRPGTGPGADESPDVTPSREEPAAEQPDRDRWLREQRPPHWE